MKKPKAKSPKLKAKSEQRIAKSQQQIAVMLELLRSAVLGRDPVLDPDVNVDWDGLMERASKQGILAWVYDGICKLPKEQQPPRQQRINWALSVNEIEDRFEKQQNVLKDIVEISKGNGFHVLVLKGLTLAVLYPKPSLRPSGDLDVYFYGDYKKANDILGIKKCKVSPKHMEFDYHGVKIENHLSFLDLDWPVRCAINDFLVSRLEYAFASKDGYYVMDPQSQLLFLLAHAMMHLEGCVPALSIRSIIDIPMLLKKYSKELSPEQCFELVDCYKMYNGFELFMYFGEWSLGIDLSQYRRNIVSSKDVDYAYLFFMNFDFSADEFQDGSIKDFFQFMWRRNSFYNWKSKFLYVKSGERLNYQILNIRYIMKFLFGVPINKPLRKKFKTHLKSI